MGPKFKFMGHIFYVSGKILIRNNKLRLCWYLFEFSICFLINYKSEWKIKLFNDFGSLSVKIEWIYRWCIYWIFNIFKWFVLSRSYHSCSLCFVQEFPSFHDHHISDCSSACLPEVFWIFDLGSSPIVILFL